MAWKPEYAANRRKKYQNDPEYRERRKSQGRKSEENKEYMREYYQNNKEKFQTYARENRDRKNARRRERYANDPEYRAEILRLAKEQRNPEAIRDYRLRKTFGITAQEYDDQLELQGDGCAICRNQIDDNGGRRLAVDHCHDSGLIRGILCSECNLGLGKFKDDPFILARAIDYLQRANAMAYLGGDE